MYEDIVWAGLMQAGVVNAKCLLNCVRSYPNATIMVIADMVLSVTLLYCIRYSPPCDNVLNFYAHAEAMKARLIPYLTLTSSFPSLSLMFLLIPELFTSDPDTNAALFKAEVVLHPPGIVLHPQDLQADLRERGVRSVGVRYPCAAVS